jgi:SAM-dependent methyltransferase
VTSSVGEVFESIWVASALVTALGEPALADDDPRVELLAGAGLLEPGDGGWTPTEAVRREVPAQRVAMERQRLISALGQAATIASRGAGGGWGGYSDDVLLAQGRFSAAAGRAMQQIVSSIPELAAALEDCPVMIDVGVGVAAAACAICEAVPAIRVIGLDVSPRALELARELVTERALTERVELRLQGVEELQDVGVASLAHIPPPFIPRPALEDGVVRLFRALRPGGRLVLSGISSDGAAGAIGRWQAYNAGGSAVTLEECAALVTAAGFEAPQGPPGLPPGAPPVVFCRRP